MVTSTVALVLTGLSAIASALAVAAWLKFFGSRARSMKQPDELGNRQLNAFGWVWIIANERPDPFRTFCNSVVLAVGVLLAGLPHFLVIAEYWHGSGLTSLYLLHYGWTLAWWLIVLTAPCLVFVRNREAKARRFDRSPSDA